MTKNTAYPRLKTLHLISGDLWAGAESMAFNLLKRLKDYEDLDTSVILLNEGRLAEELRACGLAIHIIDESRHSFREILLKIQHVVGSRPPDIIHSHRYKENLLALLISGCCRGVRLFATQHGLPEYHGNNAGVAQRFKTWVNFRALSRCFTTVAVSEDIRHVLISRFGFPKEKVEVVRNGIELPPFPFPCSKTGPFVIGSSGRLFPVKDYPLMVEIARAVAAIGGEDIRFELAGDGPERSALEALIQCNGLGANFILKGHQNDMNTFYRGLDVYLNTSVHEGIPMTILEALAHGLPVIAPAVGGIVEIIDDGTQGLLVGSRTPGEFSEKCMILRDNRGERERMGLAAREKADREFSAERMAEQYHRLYRRAVITS